MRFKLGDRVRSKKVGCRDAFEGVIVLVRPMVEGSNFPESYDVEDEDGQQWNRDATEIRAVVKSEAA